MDRITIDPNGALQPAPKDGKVGKDGAIKKATFFGYSVSIGKEKLNKGSLIDHLKQTPEGQHLKKEWFLGLLGGSSKKEVQKVYQKVYNVAPAAKKAKVAKIANIDKPAKNELPTFAGVQKIIRNGDAGVKIFDDPVFFAHSVTDVTNPIYRTKRDPWDRPNLDNTRKLNTKGEWKTVVRDGKKAPPTDTKSTSFTPVKKDGTGTFYNGFQPGHVHIGVNSSGNFVSGVLVDTSECRLAQHGIYIKDGWTNKRPWLKQQGQGDKDNDPKLMQQFEESIIRGPDAREKLIERINSSKVKQPYSEMLLHVNLYAIKSTVCRDSKEFSKPEVKFKLICEKMFWDRKLASKRPGINLPITIVNSGENTEVEFTEQEQKEFLQDKSVLADILFEFRKNWMQPDEVQGACHCGIMLKDICTKYGIQVPDEYKEYAQ